MRMTLAQAAAMLPGAVLHGDARTVFSRVHSDTRTLRPGDLFVALRGERFDAHDFLPQARAAGAVAALAERGLDEAGLAGLQVPDALQALQQLARAHRRVVAQQVSEANVSQVGAGCTLPVIAVVGSNGKTTVTQMIGSILRAWRGESALATAGNLNNHIGLPLTVMRLDDSHRAAVFELGMNHPGEIALLAGIAQPTVVVMTNAQREHQEFMASVEAVARENGAAIGALAADGVAVFPADDAQAGVWRAQAAGRRCVTFARSAGVSADLRLQAAWAGEGAPRSTDGPAPVTTANCDHWALTLHTPAGHADTTLSMAGEHNLHNALAAAAATWAAGVPLAAIVSGLTAFRPVAGRSHLGRWEHAGRSVPLVDDSYNANPDSVRAAIDMLAGLPAPHWLVLGDMGEVGDQGPAFHAEVGAHARARGIEVLWTVGTLCAGTAAAFRDAGPGGQAAANGPSGSPSGVARHFEDVEALIDALGDAPACGSVLVKGSRFMRMERVVAALHAAGSGGRDAA